MTTKARNWTMNPGLMKIGVWNVTGLYGKEKLLQKEFKKSKCRYSSDTRKKKKLKGSQELDDYILLYKGVPTNRRAAAGIAIMIKAKFKKRIHGYVFVSERILQLRYKLQRGYLTLLSVYAPEVGKTEQTEEFNETLQDQIDKINKNYYIVVAGDYNERFGNIPIDGILGTNGEITTNSNGHKLKEFASVNELKPKNTFSDIKRLIK